MTYTIKQFAHMFQVSEHTIRYYTDIELLPCQRDSGNRRIFDEASLNRMQVITCLRQSGASIEAIREYCRLCTLPESRENFQARYQIILHQQEEAQRRLEEAQRTVDYMAKKVKHYQDILDGLAPDDTNPEIRGKIS